jgi:hypothetical protein
VTSVTRGLCSWLLEINFVRSNDEVQWAENLICVFRSTAQISNRRPVLVTYFLRDFPQSLRKCQGVGVPQIRRQPIPPTALQVTYRYIVRRYKVLSVVK